MEPFIKWAGGKRWLIQSEKIKLPEFEGRYIEPFLGGGAVFFHLNPKRALLSDLNPRLIDVYSAIRDDWKKVFEQLKHHQKHHSKDYYYRERARKRRKLTQKAAQFLYLNRTCFNGLYRENLRGEFNVPIGTKSKVLMPKDNFELASKFLQNAELACCDFADTIDKAAAGDLLFVDPPYTAAHNFNGFVKYNQKIFSWDDQLRLKEKLVAAKARGAKSLLTNAHHESILGLYSDIAEPQIVNRVSVISGKNKARNSTTEVLFAI